MKLTVKDTKFVFLSIFDSILKTIADSKIDLSTGGQLAFFIARFTKQLAESCAMYKIHYAKNPIRILTAK
jgi:hypothetical protein